MYADYLNRHRPHGHKVSWKKLSRPQKEAAERIADLAHERRISIRSYLELMP